YVGGMYHSE
ncbi:enoyl-CoA hydratase/isomerase family protein, partial [Vibrio parahaemolyticus EKP-008]